MELELMNTWEQKQVVHFPAADKSKMLVGVSGFFAQWEMGIKKSIKRKK